MIELKKKINIQINSSTIGVYLATVCRINILCVGLIYNYYILPEEYRLLMASQSLLQRIPFT